MWMYVNPAQAASSVMSWSVVNTSTDSENIFRMRYMTDWGVLPSDVRSGENSLITDKSVASFALIGI